MDAPKPCPDCGFTTEECGCGRGQVLKDGETEQLRAETIYLKGLLRKALPFVTPTQVFDRERFLLMGDIRRAVED